MDDDIDRKQILRMNIKEGVSAAESLKKRIRESTITNTSLTPPSTTILLPSPTITQHDGRKFK